VTWTRAFVRAYTSMYPGFSQSLRICTYNKTVPGYAHQATIPMVSPCFSGFFVLVTATMPHGSVGISRALIEQLRSRLSNKGSASRLVP
jgi:hypothetical protein